MQYYQFEKVFSQMEREFGKVKAGQEDDYAMMLYPLESNALKVHREYPAANSRRLKEAIALVLFDLKERYNLNGEKFNTDNFRNEDNQILEKALLMAFDPFTNEELKDAVEAQYSIDWTDRNQLYNYYQEPIKCLLKIHDSVNLWIKQRGADGYFIFIEEFMGAKIKDDQMTYFIQLPDPQ